MKFIFVNSSSEFGIFYVQYQAITWFDIDRQLTSVTTIENKKYIFGVLT